MNSPLLSRLPACVLASVLGVALLPARAGDLAFSDPANVPPPPPHAIGFPNRAPDFDVLPGFRQPPAGYGEVAFYWWLGDPLTRERLGWQLDQLARVGGVIGLQINYAHTDRGGLSYGLTFPSEPALFSPAWWELVDWFLGEAKQRGMAISLSDYTLGVGQGWSVDEVLRAQPELQGSVLKAETKEIVGGQPVTWPLTSVPLAITAHRLEDGRGVAGPGVDLRSSVENGSLHWTAPQGRWRLVAVRTEAVAPSLDPMHPGSGEAYARKFFGQFTDRHPNEGGRGLNWFFSDELEFRVQGNLWTARFADEFRRRKGYDLLPELAALFTDIGPRTPKVRLDYSDVKVALTEEGFFKPVFDWHQQRGMIYGCDHGGRGRNVVEFGDYFRTQRWNQGPGCDQPGLGRDVIKNKVASSIAHLYQRPKVWLEGFYGSGWGTSSEQLADATFINFVQGQNLLTLHGLYYSTHGGWWEWAPPCNHFRMPYWPHMKEFFACTRRLSYLLSQGDHRCDVAIVYPVAPMEAGLGGEESVKAAFDLGERLYRQGIDFDFMDFESLDRARIEAQELRVSGERYRALVLPAMRAARWSTVTKAVEFAAAGGLVVTLGALPEASDRAGRDDPELAALTARLSHRAANVDEVRTMVESAFPRDFECAGSTGSGERAVMHRRIGSRDVFAVYGAAEGVACSFRATGRVELWDPWTGQVRPLPVLAQAAGTTRLRMPLTAREVQLIVFSPGAAVVEVTPAGPSDEPRVVPLDGPWEFELQPTLDNRFGDFRWPPTPTLIGPEARRFRYADETTPNPGWEAAHFDDSTWPHVTASFGPQFWKLGPLPEEIDTATLERQLGELSDVDPALPVGLGGKAYSWQPYRFSWRWGLEDDPGHQGWHGLKEEMHDEFIGLGKLATTGTGTSYEKEAGGSRYYLWTSVVGTSNAPASLAVGGLKPTVVWLNHARHAGTTGKVEVKRGSNPLLLRYDTPGRGYLVVQTGEPAIAASSANEAFTPGACWIWTSREDREVADRCFRQTFTLDRPPSKARLRITCDNGYTAFLNGQEFGRGNRWETVQDYDLTRRLRPGTNVIAVLARNEGGEAGLIAELVTTMGALKTSLSTAGDAAGGTAVLLGTDATWRWAGREEPGWRELDFDASRWAGAWELARFGDSLWAHHPQGPPRLESPRPAGPTANAGSLAMSWNDKPGLLPFDTRPQTAAPAGWYRFLSPPGLRAMTLAVRGRVRAWADGGECSMTTGRRGEDGSTELKFNLARAAVGPVVVALRIEQERGAYGGAALPGPIALECVAGQAVLGDWTKQGVLEGYSGGAWYRRNFALTRQQAGGRVRLDLGNLSSSAEVRVNGRPVGVRVAPPWRFDLTPFVQAGDNRVEVLVLSALGGHYATIPTRYRGSLVSGLLGPVRLTLETMPTERSGL